MPAANRVLKIRVLKNRVLKKTSPGKYSPEKSFGPKKGAKNHWIGPVYFDGTEANSPHGGKGYGQYFGNIDVEFQKGHETARYIIVVLAGGAYAFDQKQISLDIINDGLSAKERIDLIKDALQNFINVGAMKAGDITPASEQ